MQRSRVAVVSDHPMRPKRNRECDIGVPLSLHTDAAVTPLGCLHAMWCAVNCVTPKGGHAGLGLDKDMGSIQPGKWADFTVLEESPLDVDPMAIRDITVWGTVLAGVKQPGAGAAKLTG